MYFSAIWRPQDSVFPSRTKIKQSITTVLENIPGSIFTECQYCISTAMNKEILLFKKKRS